MNVSRASQIAPCFGIGCKKSDKVSKVDMLKHTHAVPKTPSKPEVVAPAPAPASEEIPKKKKKTSESAAKMSVADFIKNNLEASE